MGSKVIAEADVDVSGLNRILATVRPANHHGRAVGWESERAQVAAAHEFGTDDLPATGFVSKSVLGAADKALGALETHIKAAVKGEGFVAPGLDAGAEVLKSAIAESIQEHGLIESGQMLAELTVLIERIDEEG